MAKKVAKKRKNKITVPKKSHHYTRATRVVMIAVYGAFGCAFVLFARESTNNTWYIALAAVCAVMVVRHLVGMFKGYGSK